MSGKFLMLRTSGGLHPAARKQRCLNRLVIRAAGEFSSGSPLRSAGRIIEKLREFNTFSPGPYIPFPKKRAPP